MHASINCLLVGAVTDLHHVLKKILLFLVNHVQDLGFHLLNLVVHQILLYLVHKLIQKVVGWVCHSFLNKR